MLGMCFPEARQCLEGAQASTKPRLGLFSFQHGHSIGVPEVPVPTAPGCGDAT